jgi:putative tryptophan/tyrosine transport system substrate-binding protein
MIRRRQFITLLGGAAAVWPVAAFAQVSDRRRVIVWMSGLTRPASSPYIDSFLRGMREFGYVEGRDFDMVYHFSEGYHDRIPALVQEAVRIKPDIIVATAIDSVVVASKATSTIPIVSGALADPVHLGVIASQARPGGNVTGVEPYVAGLPAKQLEFARQILPRASKIGLLTNVGDPKAPPQMVEIERAAEELGITVVSEDADRPEDIERALRGLARRQADVVIVLQTSMLLNGSKQIAAAALATRLPTVFGYTAHVAAGGLLSYGVDLRWCFYRIAYFVNRILHGTAPGDLPVEFPTKMLLSVNLKTAMALGIEVPAELLARADEVIE